MRKELGLSLPWTYTSRFTDVTRSSHPRIGFRTLPLYFGLRYPNNIHHSRTYLRHGSEHDSSIHVVEAFRSDIKLFIHNNRNMYSFDSRSLKL